MMSLLSVEVYHSLDLVVGQTDLAASACMQQMKLFGLKDKCFTWCDNNNIWNSRDCRRLPPSTVTLTFDPLTRKPNLVSWSRYITWSNSGDIICNSYEDIVFIRFCGSLAAVTLTFDLLIAKSNQHTYEPKYTCDQNWVEFLSLLCEMFTRVLGRTDSPTHS